jgi:hypothetical protein
VKIQPLKSASKKKLLVEPVFDRVADDPRAGIIVDVGGRRVVRRAIDADTVIARSPMR